MPDWPDWSGQTVVIVASGPSAKDVPLAIGRNHARFLAVKDGWRLCTWADALYGCDDHWWKAYDYLPEFAGLRLAYYPQTLAVFAERGWPALKVDVRPDTPRLLFDRVGEVGWGGHSGFHAINLAIQFGARRLVLVGYDLRVDKGRHFFGAHPYPGDRPSASNTERWRQTLDGEAAVIAARGVKVFNVSPVSSLTAYPKTTFAEAIA